MSNIYRQTAYSRSQRRPNPHTRDGTSRPTNKQIKPNINEINNFDEFQFGHNHVIPKRNVFTAHFKNQQNTEDLIFATNLLPKKQPIKRFNQTAKQGFRNNIERPQSKQQPRNRGWNKSGSLLKSALIENGHRPQTSKGQRPRLSFKEKTEQLSHRQNSQQNDEFKGGMFSGHIQKKLDDGFLISSSSSARKGINKGRFDFKTSIDPEFLSLFAN